MATMTGKVFAKYRSTEEFLTDDEMGELTNHHRRCINNARFGLREKGWCFEMRNVVSDKGKSALAYRIRENNGVRGTMSCADPIKKGVPKTVFAQIAEQSEFATDQELCHALSKLNVEGYWDFMVLSAMMGTTYKTAYHRVKNLCDRYGLRKHVRGFPDSKQYRIVWGDVEEIKVALPVPERERAKPEVSPLMKLALGLGA